MQFIIGIIKDVNNYMKYAPNQNVLYEIIGILSEADLPLVFKGANVTNILLKQSNSPYTRRTTDIDSSWKGKNPTTEGIESLLKSALKPYGYTVEKIRELKGKQVSAGFRVLKDGIPVTKMDIDIHNVKQCEKYSIGTVEFIGVTAEEIIADKLCAVSNEHVYRRSKDLMDIYSLTEALNINMNDVIESINFSNHKLGSFGELALNKEKIFEAYSNLKVSNKPDFDEVYECVLNYAKDISKKKNQKSEPSVNIDIADDFDDKDIE